MSSMKDRVLLSYSERLAKRSFEAVKLFEIMTELSELRKSLEDFIKGSVGQAEHLDTQSNRNESSKEQKELEDKIEKKMEEYAQVNHRMYPKHPLNDCYPEKVKKEEYPFIFKYSENNNI